MHRSGTSYLVRTLVQTGVCLPANLLPEAADNPEGFQESADFVAHNEALLAQADLLIAVGDRAAGYPIGAEGVETAVFTGTDEAVAGVAALIRPGDVVLVKGSLGMRMKIIVAALEALATPPRRIVNGG